MDGKIWALKANSLTSPLTVTVTGTVNAFSSPAHKSVKSQLTQLQFDATNLAISSSIS